ncbi:3-phosphoshikimate 1-carboxyvinyltransferase [Cohnella herbarum]|nr:3-phosphoshikimate 1-carboxyvinyltransferase [Cohnella herbarum]
MDVDPHPQMPIRKERSPWCTNNDQRNVMISPSKGAIDGTIRLTGSKSLTNRALIIAALAEGTSRIEGMLRSDDSYWCIDCLVKLGIKVDIEDESVTIEGCGGAWPIPSGELYVGAAGTVARFLPGALAIGNGAWTIHGSKRMSERPLTPLLNALERLGANVEYPEAGRYLPFTLEAKGLTGGEVGISGSVSSQFISGLALAAPYAKQPVTVQIDGEVVQREYVEMTLEMMNAFGISPQVSDNGQSIIIPTGKYKARSISLEPDVSACCYFWALAALTAGRVRIDGIHAARTRQPDIEFLDVLERMGCSVYRGEDFVEVQGPEKLKGGFTMSMRKFSDQTLTLAAMAPFADAPITLSDAAHIRHHECDRISAICSELRNLGIRIDEHHDGLTVYPGQPLPAAVDTHDDHRMAMSLALIGSKVDGVQIGDPGCVSKTCPDYFERIAALGIQVKY